MKKNILIATLAFVLLGTAAAAEAKVYLKTEFDKEKAYALTEPGNNTIIGIAILKKNSGEKVATPQGSVTLIPVTAHATERMKHRYGSDVKGKRGIYADEVEFFPDLPGYDRLTLSTTSDKEGFFKFTEIMDGDFFLIAPAIGVTRTQVQEVWTDGYVNTYTNEDEYGYWVMQRISVKGGKEHKVVIEVDY